MKKKKESSAEETEQTNMRMKTAIKKLGTAIAWDMGRSFTSHVECLILEDAKKRRRA